MYIQCLYIKYLMVKRFFRPTTQNNRHSGRVRQRRARSGIKKKMNYINFILDPGARSAPLHWPG